MLEIPAWRLVCRLLPLWHCALFCALIMTVSGSWGGATGSNAPCQDQAMCNAKLTDLVERLRNTQETMNNKKVASRALEDLRTGLVHGQRVYLPSPHRQHLEKGSPLVGEVSYDSKHRPLSTNVSKHLRHVKTVASGVSIRYHGLMSVRRPSTPGKAGGGPTSLVVTVDSESKLSLHTLDGESRLSGFDLGHHASHFALSHTTDHSYVLTGDEAGELRVHEIKLELRPVGRNTSDAPDVDAGATAEKPKGNKSDKPPQKKLHAALNLTARFSMPSAGENRKLTAVVSVDRGSQPFFLAADSHGSVAVFFKNGTLKGQIKITEDPGGVRGLLRGQGQTVLFFSSHSFGFFSASMLELTTPPCTGWNSPLFDVAPDPYSSYSRVVLSLSDGDVLVFSTVTGKNKEKVCDLTLKFPRVSPLPFRLYIVRGHVLALPTPLETTKRANDHSRELFFFNIAAMEAGYGTTESRTVTFQASFSPRRVDTFAFLATSGGSAGGGSGSSTKMHLALGFEEKTSGIELYELTLRNAPVHTPGGGGAGGTGGGGSGGSDLSGWLDYIPKVGIFGITLIGVVIWNVRKVANKKTSSSGLDDFDDELLKERLRKRREENANKSEKPGLHSDEKLDKLMAKTKEKTSQKKKKLGGGLDDDFGGLGDLKSELDDLKASSKEMEELLSSMNHGDD